MWKLLERLEAAFAAAAFAEEGDAETAKRLAADAAAGEPGRGPVRAAPAGREGRRVATFPRERSARLP